ncbi:glycerate kinase family protein [Kutzneria sp. CA-103260]|uniref:glycerate kinase family protein n=1 Tax=Kutzneria sp. CA-103260 TaxID=2802641 RepID=UPI001BA760CB|nr:glycerate kinase [Kutzneria sp. CA-103260]QUQ67791.1 glycerate kinase [Kutzneria sp. CA-103260]
MRVLVAPDCFGGTLTALEAAEAIAAGWRRTAPADELLLRPLADGGPGFVEVLHGALGGEVHEARVTGPLGHPVTARWLAHDGTAYIESAQACGLHLTDRRDPETSTTYGVGELIAAAREAGLTKAVVGLGGSGTTDGGAGMIRALGGHVTDDTGNPIGSGGTDLARAEVVELPAVGITLVAASDVENPLLGRHGAARTFGPQKGADPAAVERLEAGLTTWAEVLRTAGQDVRDSPGAGAAGGLGAGLLALGAEFTSGSALVRTLTRLDEALDQARLAITGEGSFDWQSLRGKLITAVAAGAADRGIACLVLAGQVSVGRREAGAVGVEQSYAVAEHAGSVAAAMADPAGALAALAADVAGQWSRANGR